jgi:hypothetical protein
MPRERGSQRGKIRENLGVPALGEKNVGGLDVPVDDSLGVRRIQCIQGLAVEKLYRNEGLAVVFTDLVDGANRLGVSSAALNYTSITCMWQTADLEGFLATQGLIYAVIDELGTPANSGDA